MAGITITQTTMNNRITEKEFWEMADNWYQRAHKLRVIWQDESQADLRKAKAFRLWVVMYERVMKCIPMATELHIRPVPHNFKKGGYVPPFKQGDE